MKRLRVAGMIALCVVLIAVLAGCSEPDDQRWPQRSFGQAQTVINVAIPASNPHTNNNATERLVTGATNDLVAQWDPHPDVEVRLLTNQNCMVDQSTGNCFEIWRVSQSVTNPLGDQSMAPPSCWPGCAFALKWADNVHYFNHNGGTSGTAGTQRAVIIYPIEWEVELTDLEWRNMLCHEGGHFMSLLHWDDDNDGEPDAEGPCVDAVPDRDTDPSDGTAPAFDWSALDIAYARCVRTDAAYAPPGFQVQTGIEEEVDAETTEGCGESLQSQTQSEGNGPVAASFNTDDIEVFTDE